MEELYGPISVGLIATLVSVFSQIVKVWRTDILRIVSDITPAHIIDQNHQDIWQFSFLAA